MAPKHILAALTFHHMSAVVEAAAQVADQLGADLRLIHVDPLRRSGQEMRPNSDDHLRSAQLAATAQGVDTAVFRRFGMPIEEIVGVMSEDDLLMIHGGGAHDVDHLSRIALALIARAGRPTLILLEGDHEDEHRLVCAVPDENVADDMQEGSLLADALGIDCCFVATESSPTRSTRTCEYYYG